MSQLGNLTHARMLCFNCGFFNSGSAVRMAGLSSCVIDLTSHAVSTGSILIRVFGFGLGKWQMLLSRFYVFDLLLDVALTVMSPIVDQLEHLVSRSVAVIAWSSSITTDKSRWKGRATLAAVTSNFGYFY